MQHNQQRVALLSLKQQAIAFSINIEMVPPTRIERVALPLGGGCSIH